METDQHIEFFWTALEMFTQEELCKFIKFACNQERIPFTCPCKDGGPDTAHVPPYPMKIAPPDGGAGKCLEKSVVCVIGDCSGTTDTRVKATQVTKCLMSSVLFAHKLLEGLCLSSLLAHTVLTWTALK